MKKEAGCFQRIFTIFIVMFGLALFAIINSGRDGRPSGERVTIIEASQTPRATSSNANADSGRTLNESRIANSLTALSDAELSSIEIVDGRANGGEISLIVSFLLPDADDSLVSVFLAIGSAIEQYEMNIDGVVLIYSSCGDCETGMLVANSDDLLAWVRAEIDNDEFIARLRETND